MRISFKLATRSGPIALIAERNVSVAFFSCIFFLLIVTRNDRAGDFFFRTFHIYNVLRFFYHFDFLL